VNEDRIFDVVGPSEKADDGALNYTERYFRAVVYRRRHQFWLDMRGRAQASRGQKTWTKDKVELVERMME
jgi:hypothetical protein